MKNKLITGLRALLQVFSILLLHLLVLHLMNIKIVKWEEIALRQIFVVYSVLFVLLYATCIITLLTKKPKYNFIWFFISTAPSIGILFYLEKIKESKSTGAGFIDFKFDEGFVELMFIFPLFYFFIQLVFIITLWILKYPKKKFMR